MVWIGGIHLRTRVTCGIDWASDHHDVAGFNRLISLLAEHGDTPTDPIPVAIETSRGLLVANLRATGRPVYTINPMAAARYRERGAVSRKKSDHLDAMTLAGILEDRLSRNCTAGSPDHSLRRGPCAIWSIPRSGQ